TKGDDSITKEAPCARADHAGWSSSFDWGWRRLRHQLGQQLRRSVVDGSRSLRWRHHRVAFRSMKPGYLPNVKKEEEASEPAAAPAVQDVAPARALHDEQRIEKQLMSVADPIGFLVNLFTHAPVGFAVWSADGRALLTNKAFMDIFLVEPPPEY